MIFTKKQRSIAASYLGFINTIVLAVEFIDFDNFDTGSINQWIKLLLVLTPAVGGYFSEVKGKTLNDVKP